MLIEKNSFYVNRYTVGKYHVYLALEDAEEMNELIKVIDLTNDSVTYIQSEFVYEVEEEKIEQEYLDVAKKYL